MKSIKICLVIVLSVFFFFLYSSCVNNKSNQHAGFVYVKDNNFILNDSVFFPMMLNYIVEFRKIEDSILISPAKYYENTDVYETNTIETNEKQLIAHIELIKELGFNTLRVIVLDRLKYNINGLYYQSDSKIYLRENKESIILALDQFVKLAENNGLRIMLLLENSIEEPEIEDFNISILKHFSNNSTIFSYDFFNEPLYFDNSKKPNHEKNRSKESVFEISQHWKELMEEYAPFQLFTIGLSEPIEVFEWDPSILPVDFIAFHTYHPLRVPNEIYWYSKYCNKPWMIGETALPADNDSIPYFHQTIFLKETYQKVLNCGGAGLGWWEFQDLPDSHFEASYTGLLNHEGVTYTKKNNYPIIGTVKPAGLVINELKHISKNECKCHSNYYNMLGYYNYVIKGQIIDSETNKPIEGAVIRGCNNNWSICQNTFTDINGNFTLYSNDRCTRFYFSAPGMSFIETTIDTLSYSKTKGSIIDEGYLENRKLEYHKILYQTFLEKRDTINSILLFDSKLFNTSHFEANVGIIELEPISLD